MIPVVIRKELGLNVSDMLDVHLNTANACIELKKADSTTEHLGGSLSSYAKGKNFTSRKQMHDAFAKGMPHEA